MHVPENRDCDGMFSKWVFFAHCVDRRAFRLERVALRVALRRYTSLRALGGGRPVSAVKAAGSASSSAELLVCPRPAAAMDANQSCRWPPWQQPMMLAIDQRLRPMACVSRLALMGVVCNAAVNASPDTAPGRDRRMVWGLRPMWGLRLSPPSEECRRGPATVPSGTSLRHDAIVMQRCLGNCETLGVLSREAPRGSTHR